MVDKLRQVSLWATNEALLSRQLGRLMAQWEGALIRLQRHPSRSDLHLFSNTDELCASLDDSLLLLTTLRTSKYASSIEGDLAAWTGMLCSALTSSNSQRKSVLINDYILYSNFD